MTTKGEEGSAGRSAEVRRKTRETEVRVAVDLDRAASPRIATGVGFFEHMLTALGTHGRFALEVEAKGDLEIDGHHLIEDVGIVLGTAIRQALGHDLRIQRFAHAYAPLDEALARAVVDVSGRGQLHFSAAFTRERVGDFEVELAREFFEAFASNAKITLHLEVIHGRNTHHQLEALFKALALALRDAFARDEALIETPSTKGTLSESQATLPAQFPRRRAKRRRR